MKFVDALGNIKFGKAMFFGNNIQMSEQADGIVTINAAVLSGTGSKLSLLGDVLVTSVQDDQFVRWNAGTSLWVNQFITAADLGAGTFKAGTFTFPGPVIANGNLTASGTNTLIGVNQQQIGSSVITAKWPSVLFADSVLHNYSGTTETSFTSYLLKGNSLVTDGQAIRLRGTLNSSLVAGAFNVKVGVGNVLVVSGTLGGTQTTTFEGYFWRTGSSSLRTEWTFYSGTTLTSTSPAVLTSVLYGFHTYTSTTDWTQDQLIDLRGNNYITSSNNLTLVFFQISYEAS